MKTYSRLTKTRQNSSEDYSKSCRLCLNSVQVNSLINVFTRDSIKFCVGLEVSDDDGLPGKLCESCLSAIAKFNSFKKMCLTNELKLKNLKVQRSFTEENTISIDESVFVKTPESLEIDMNDRISLNQEKCDAVSFLLEEDYIHPDAPDEVIFQIKKNYSQPGKPPRDYSQPQSTDHENLSVPNVANNKDSACEPFTDREALPRHYACIECNARFSRTDRLIWHEKHVHNIERMFCGHCSKSFVSKSLIELHMKTHTCSKPFTCTVCSKTFSQKESMNRHFVRLHCERKYECDKCPKLFTSREGLKSHYFTHHTVRTIEDLYRYKCKFCTKSFCHSSGLSRHLLTHTGVIFTCKLCQKGFSDGSCLRRHSLIVHPSESQRFAEETSNSMEPKTLLTQNSVKANTINNGKSSRAEQLTLPFG